MTLCIAAICNNGRNVICASDGMLSDMASGASGDVGAKKGVWFGDWMFLFAGHLHNCDLIMEEVRLQNIKDKDCLSRAGIQTTLRNAYKRHLAKWSADRFLAQYYPTMEEFRRKGRSEFGDERFAELSRAMETDAQQNYGEQIIAVGYGKTVHAAAVFRIDGSGLSSHNLEGFTAIGSGATSALSTLLTSGYSRDLPLEEALYMVCAAAFSAEGRDGVGPLRLLAVVHKRDEKEPKEKLPGELIQPDEIAKLRRAWDRYGRPTIPKAALVITDEIARRIGVTSVGNMTRMVNSAAKKNKQKH